MIGAILATVISMVTAGLVYMGTDQNIYFGLATYTFQAPLLLAAIYIAERADD